MTPKISVIIPAYNYAHYLPRAIGSVLDQTFDDLECIVIDDCSSDDTTRVLAEFKDKRLVILKNSQNVGVNRTINRGLKLARGTYCCVVAADDTIPRDSLRDRFQVIVEDDFDAVHAGLTRHEGDKRTYVKPYPGLTPDSMVQFLLGQKVGFGINNATFLYNRRIFKQIGYRSTSKKVFPHNDYEFVLRVLLNCRISSVDKSCYDYEIHTESHSDIHATTADGSLNYQNLIKRYIKLFSDQVGGLQQQS